MSQLWDYSERSCAFIFGEDVGDPVADRILKELKKTGEQGLTRTEITSDVFHRNLKPGSLSDALDRLRDAGLAFGRCAQMIERTPNDRTLD